VWVDFTPSALQSFAIATIPYNGIICYGTVTSRTVLQNDYVTLEEYQLWSLEDPLPTILLNMVFEICHVVLGLRPSSPEEEGTVIRGWMHRCVN